MSFTSLTIKFPEPVDERGRRKPPPRWHAYNLIPDPRVFGEDAEHYQMKMLCMEVAEGKFSEYKILYEETEESKVWEAYGMYLARHYPTS